MMMMMLAAKEERKKEKFDFQMSFFSFAVFKKCMSQEKEKKIIINFFDYATRRFAYDDLSKDSLRLLCLGKNVFNFG